MKGLYKLNLWRFYIICTVITLGILIALMGNGEDVPEAQVQSLPDTVFSSNTPTQNYSLQDIYAQKMVVVKSGDCYSYKWGDHVIEECYPTQEQAENKIERMRQQGLSKTKHNNKVWEEL